MERTRQRPGIRPRLTLGRRLDIAAQLSFPGISTMLLMLLAKAPFGIAGETMLLPAVTLASVWFWSLWRTVTMPPPLVFVIGFLLDLLAYEPLGVGVLTLLAVHGIALACRRRLAPQGFLVVWGVFALVAVAAGLVEWCLSAALMVRLLSPAPALFRAAVAVALYPALTIILLGAHRAIASPNQS